MNHKIWFIMNRSLGSTVPNSDLKTYLTAAKCFKILDLLRNSLMQRYYVTVQYDAIAVSRFYYF